MTMSNTKPMVLNALAAVVTLLAVTACTPRDPNWRNSRNAPVAAGEAVAANTPVAASTSPDATADAAARLAANPEAAGDPVPAPEDNTPLADAVGTYQTGETFSETEAGRTPLEAQPDAKANFLKIVADGRAYSLDLNSPELANLTWNENGRVEVRDGNLFWVIPRKDQEDLRMPFQLQNSATAVLQLESPGDSPLLMELNRTDNSRVEEALATELESRRETAPVEAPAESVASPEAPVVETPVAEAPAVETPPAPESAPVPAPETPAAATPEVSVPVEAPVVTE